MATTKDMPQMSNQKQHIYIQVFMKHGPFNAKHVKNHVHKPFPK